MRKQWLSFGVAGMLMLMLACGKESDQNTGAVPTETVENQDGQVADGGDTKENDGVEDVSDGEEKEDRMSSYLGEPVEVPLTEAIPAPEAAEPSVLDEVRALPAPYRSTLYLHYFEGYTAAEIGRILGAKRNTVLSWLARGRQALRERMIGGFDDA